MRHLEIARPPVAKFGKYVIIETVRGEMGITEEEGKAMSSNFLAVTRLALLVLVASLLVAGCMPINITQTIKISTSTGLFEGEAGTPIPANFVLGPVGVCDQIPEQYRDVNQLIRSLLAEIHLQFLANFIHIDGLDLMKVAFRIAEGGGSFDGITEVSASINGAPALLATPDNGISPTEIVLQPEEPIDLLGLLQDCPTVSAALQGTIPLDPPTKWDNYITVRLRAYLGFRPPSA